MELIIKPTDACNYKCTYCSSPELAESRKVELDVSKVYQFLDRFPNTQSIIVNGGDPLMMDPSYYWQIIEYLEKHNLPAQLSFTTNLEGFVSKPEKWQDLFRNPRVGVCTSFEYGDQRLITLNKPLREDRFLKISDFFLERIGYRPDFISVINSDNYQWAIDNVLLAKRLNVECKLNYAMASGRQADTFLLADMYKIYVEIIDRDLYQWEYNSKQLMRRLQGAMTTCPQNRRCDESIRALNPEGDYYSCGSIADDKEYPIDFEAEMKSERVFTPLQDSTYVLSLKDECFQCPMFQICNGCRKTIKDLKRSNRVQEHCAKMKKLAPRIIEINETYK